MTIRNILHRGVRRLFSTMTPRRFHRLLTFRIDRDEIVDVDFEDYH